MVGFFIWWFSYVPSRILYVTDKTIVKLFNFFSIDLLLKTLFLPWKRDEIDTTNMALDDRIRVLFMNLISRLVGATVRLGTIIIGLLGIILVALMGVVSLIVFIFLPVIAPALILSSIFI